MPTEDYIDFAPQSDFRQLDESGPPDESPIVGNEVEVEATERAVAKERERCAKIAEATAENTDHPAIYGFTERQSIWNVACREIAAEIRKGENHQCTTK